jgi:hypothetical protein
MLFERHNDRNTLNALHATLGATDKGDLPFIYHHLKKGCILQLCSITGTDARHLMFGVNYGSYRLGVLSSTLAKRVLDLENRGLPYRLTISRIEKEKYLPPTAIEVELEWGEESLARVA